MAKNGYKVLDSDLHVLEPADLYTTYMDPKWGDRIPRGKRPHPYGGVRYTTAQGERIRRTQATSTPDIDSQVAHRFTVGSDHDFNSASQLQAMEMEGIDVAVMFRTLPLHTDDAHEPEYANDLNKAWNDWITDFCKEDPARMKAAGLITLHDATLAAQEMRRIANDLGHVASCFTPEPVLGRQLPESYFDIVWEEAQDLNLPVTFHPQLLSQPGPLVQPLREPGQAHVAGGDLRPADGGHAGYDLHDRRGHPGQVPQDDGRHPGGQLQLAALAPLPPGRAL